jgi:predicted membrane channel-forming protein YqfA (hemolysin III family)
MLADIRPPDLLLMLAVFTLSLVLGLICILLLLSQRQHADAANTLFFLLLLAAATAVVVLPALKMHGSYSAMERLLLLLLHLANLLLTVAFIRPRLRLLAAIHQLRTRSRPE